MDLVGVLGTIVTVASFAYAIYTNREKARAEKIMKEHLVAVASHVKSVIDYGHWAWQHFGEITSQGNNIVDPIVRGAILTQAQLGTGDSLTVRTNVEAIYNYIKAIHKGLFDSDLVL